MSLTSIFSGLSLSLQFCQKLGTPFTAISFLPSPHPFPLSLKKKEASNVLKKKIFAELYRESLLNLEIGVMAFTALL